MKHLVTSILLFLSFSIYAQYHHAIGLQLTGQYYFDGRKFYFHRYPDKLKFPGINYTYYIDKQNLHSLKFSYERMFFNYDFKLIEGDIVSRWIRNYNLSYNYKVLKYKNLSLSTIGSFILMRSSIDYFSYFSPSIREFVFYGEVKYLFGNELGISFNYLVLNQLNLSSFISYSKLYNTNKNSNLFQSGFSASYKF